jgi:hypothetical protein
MKEIKCDKCGTIRGNKKGWITAIGAVNQTKYSIHLCPEHATELAGILVTKTLGEAIE